MNTNFLVPLDDRSREILCSHHLTICGAISACPEVDWNAYRRHSLRIEELRSKEPSARIALDREEFELIESRLPA